MMQNKIIRYTAYSLFFLVCLVYFLLQGFPIDLAGQLISREVEQLTDMRLTYKQIDSLFPNGVVLGGVKLAETTNLENTAPISLAADEISARISLISLIRGKIRFSLSSQLLSGNMDATASIQDGRYKIVADLNGLELIKLKFLSERLGQEFQGRFNGNIDLNIPSKNIRNLQGEVNFNMVQGKIGNQPLKIQLPQNVQQFLPADLKDNLTKGIKLPWISLGKIHGKLKFDKGKLVVSDFRIDSDDIDAGLEGHLQLQSRVQHVIAHLTLRFKPSEAKINDLLAALPAQYRDIAKDALNSELNKAKGNDGNYRYKIDGRIFSTHTKISSVFKPFKM